MRFEWDASKEEDNLKRHGIDFATAAQVFNDPDEITEYDDDHSLGGEDRWTTIGLVDGLLLLVRVTWTERDGDDIIRIISARLAGPKDRALYHDG